MTSHFGHLPMCSYRKLVQILLWSHFRPYFNILYAKVPNLNCFQQVFSMPSFWPSKTEFSTKNLSNQAAEKRGQFITGIESKELSVHVWPIFFSDIPQVLTTERVRGWRSLYTRCASASAMEPIQNSVVFRLYALCAGTQPNHSYQLFWHIFGDF